MRQPQMGTAHRAALITLLCALAAGAHAAYSASGDVLELTPSNFEAKVKSGKGQPWIVVFYAPWCGHCKALHADWDKAGAALKGFVNVGAVDADEHRSLGSQYGIQGFPTIKGFFPSASGTVKAVDYNGGRSATQIVEWAMGQATKAALGRLGAKPSGGGRAGGGGGGGGGAGSCGGGGGGGAGGGESFYDGTAVVQLNDDNFHSQVTSGDDMWFVEFYAPWCGHCKNLKPAWIELASTLEGKVKVGAVDCTANQQTCSEYSVNGFPTIKFFGTDKDAPEDYQGGRDSGSLAGYALRHWAEQQPPPEVRELLDETVWEEHCLGHEADAALDLPAVKPHQLCVLAFLPHILDAKAAGRNAQIQILDALALKYKDRSFSYFWSEGGAQPKLEANFGVGGYGYPALIAYNPSKGKFASLKSAYELKHVTEFMENVRLGFERVSAVEGELASVEARAPWDGSDGEAPMEDEFDLADLMKDDEEAEKKKEL